MKHRRRKNLLKGLILSFATAVIVVSGAQASYHTQKAQEARSAMNQTYSPAALRALSLRSEAMNVQYQQPQGQWALELRSEAMNKKYQQLAGRPDDRSGIRGVESTSVTPDLAEIQRHVRADQSLSQSASNGPDNRAGIRGPGAVERAAMVSFSSIRAVTPPEHMERRTVAFHWHKLYHKPRQQPHQGPSNDYRVRRRPPRHGRADLGRLDRRRPVDE